MNIRRQHESDLSNLSDEELIQSYRAQGNKEIIGVLFKRYSHLVLGVCLNYFCDKDRASDAVMCIFEKLFDALLRHEVSNFTPWLCTVSKNHCLMQLRKSPDRHLIIVDDLLKFEGRIMENEHLLHRDNNEVDEETERLLNFISMLNPGQQQCIRLFYLESCSYERIAAATGFSIKAVKSHLQNGKRNLRLLMESTNKVGK